MLLIVLIPSKKAALWLEYKFCLIQKKLLDD